MEEKRPSTAKSVKIIFVVAFLCIGAIGYTSWQNLQDQKSLDKQLHQAEERISSLEETNKFDEKQIKKDQYQAIFLTDGQVYFGNITNITKESIKIRDIYYLQNGSIDRSGNNASAEAQLIKLGHELHGPEDVMMIERKNITFWENLKPDSEVSKTIKDYKKSGQ